MKTTPKLNIEPQSVEKMKDPPTSKFNSKVTLAPENLFANSSREEQSPRLDLKEKAGNNLQVQEQLSF